MVLIADGKYMLYICSPNVQTVRGLLERNMRLSDLPMHDAVRDLILLNQSRLSQVELKYDSSVSMQNSVSTYIIPIQKY